MVQIKFSIIICLAGLFVYTEEYRASTIRTFIDLQVHGEQIDPSTIFVECYVQ